MHALLEGLYAKSYHLRSLQIEGDFLYVIYMLTTPNETYFLEKLSADLGQGSSDARVKCLAFKDMFYLLHFVYPYISWPSSWIDLIKLIEGCKHELRVWKVNWERPPPNTFQLNTNGSALSNPGKIGGGRYLKRFTR
ncbi:hypothetical protein H5410_022298 [Solanum commersonii]|uniref:RNase H type-1 domain-containing protein n=1 Tax=Solanum commersonii TaxID=4109 RepID=A0A9J5ZDT8_SOLCO|nr:hypothetical protein H5410_022298 [Solanum commersonii]